MPVSPTTEQIEWSLRRWIPIKDGDGRAFGLYRRHYSAAPKSSGIRLRQFTGPGEYLALLTLEQNALFVWDRKQLRDDRQDGVNCAIFRNEGEHLSSELIIEAEEWAMERWGKTRVFTYVNASKIASINPGYCFKVAGWRHEGYSKNGLHRLAKAL